MESDLQHWRALGERLSTAMLITNPHGQTVWMNAAQRALCGYSLDELRGHKPGRMLQTLDTDPVAVKLIADRLAANRPVQSQLLNRHKDGSLYWVDLQIIPAHDDRGELDGYVALQTDITAQREAEAELHQRDATLQRTQQAVQQARDLLEGFCQELRTPLNALMALTDLLRDTPLVDSQQEYVQAAQRAALSLAGTVNDVIDFNRIESGQPTVTPAPLRLQAVLDDVMGVLQTHLHQQPVALRAAIEGVEDPPSLWLLGDGPKLQRVLLNLGSNALKFTQAGEVSLRLTVSPAEPQANGAPSVWLEAAVEDTGLGIPPEAIERLFQPFLHDHRSSRFSGAGLGLMISNHLVQAMGGEPIEAHSTPGLGSTFRFALRLPVVRGSTPAPVPHRPEADATARPLAGLNVLAVDSDAPFRRALAELLVQAGAEVALAEHGAAALAHLTRAEAGAAVSPDVVLMELHLPVMDGLEVTRTLRAHPRWGALPVVALTGGASPDERTAAMAAGVGACLSKPVSRAALVDTLLSATA